MVKPKVKVKVTAKARAMVKPKAKVTAKAKPKVKPKAKVTTKAKPKVKPKDQRKRRLLLLIDILRGISGG